MYQFLLFMARERIMSIAGRVIHAGIPAVSIMICLAWKVAASSRMSGIRYHKRNSHTEILLIPETHL
jgi:hypothetical protein